MTSIETTGNIAEPTLKFANSGTPYLSFSLADTPRRKNPQTGEWEDAGQTMWLACTLWGPDAEHFAGRLAKGSRVTVHGSLTVRDYQTQQGETRQSLDVRVNALQVHERREQGGQQQRSQPGYGQPSAGYGQPQGQWGPPQSDSAPF